jgi:hypothetical protein
VLPFVYLFLFRSIFVLIHTLLWLLKAVLFAD